MNDVPQNVLDENAELDALLAQLENGQVQAPEATETPEVEVEVKTGIDTVKDEPVVTEAEDFEQLRKAEQRYATLQGMMKADAQRSSDIIHKLQEQLTEQKVAEVEAPLDVKSILSEEEMAEFGEQGVETLRKLAGAMAAKEVNKAKLDVEQKLTEMRELVAQVKASADGTTVWDQVEAINPGAKEINDRDLGWFAFLDLVDPVSGRLNRELGEASANVGDLQRLSELIDAYRTHAGKSKVTPKVKPNQGPTVLINDGKQPKSDKVWTQDEIKSFYEGAARGTLGMSKDQVDAMEAEIDTAISEGRIQL